MVIRGAESADGANNVEPCPQQVLSFAVMVLRTHRRGSVPRVSTERSLGGPLVTLNIVCNEAVLPRGREIWHPQILLDINSCALADTTSPSGLAFTDFLARLASRSD